MFNGLFIAVSAPSFTIITMNFVRRRCANIVEQVIGSPYELQKNASIASWTLSGHAVVYGITASRA